MELATTNREKFHPTLEYDCRSIVQHLCMNPSVITHEVSNMFREAHFPTREYLSLTAGASTFLFVVYLAAVS